MASLAQRASQKLCHISRLAVAVNVHKECLSRTLAVSKKMYSSFDSSGPKETLPVSTQLSQKKHVPDSPSKEQVFDRVNEEITGLPQSQIFAIVHIGGRQFKVTPNDLIIVSKLQAEIGSQIHLEKVLLAGSENFTILGTPILNPDIVRVVATVIEHSLAARVIIFKKKRRNNYKRKRGHRQEITTLRINSIELKPNLK